MRPKPLIPTLIAITSLLKYRSEEHTSELQSPCNLVCRLLLEKKKNKHSQTRTRNKKANNKSDQTRSREDETPNYSTPKWHNTAPCDISRSPDDYTLHSLTCT